MFNSSINCFITPPLKLARTRSEEKKTQTTQSMSCAPGFSPSPDEEESNDEGSDCSYDVVKSKYASSKHSGEIDMLFIVITLSLIIHRQSPNSHKYP